MITLIALFLGYFVVGPVLCIAVDGIMKSYEYKKQCKSLEIQWTNAETNGYDSKKHRLVDPVLYQEAHPEEIIPINVRKQSPYYHQNRASVLKRLPAGTFLDGQIIRPDDINFETQCLIEEK